MCHLALLSPCFSSIHLSLSLPLPPSLHLLPTDRPCVYSVQTGLVDVFWGETVQLSCTYDGVPEPNTVFWRQNLTMINPLADFTLSIEYNNTMTTLNWTNMPAYGGGVYDCVAGNVLGESQNRTVVRVQCEWWVVW